MRFVGVHVSKDYCLRQVKGSMLMSVDYHTDFYQVCWCQKISFGIGIRCVICLFR